MRRIMLAVAMASVLSGCVIVTEQRGRERPVITVKVDDSTPSREHFVAPGGERSYHEWHYTPAVRIGDQVIVSGIPASRGDTYEEKVRAMFERMKVTLAGAGAGMEDVVELTTWHVGPRDAASFGEEFRIFSKVHAEYFHSHYPAWSAVGTTALLQPDAPVEMRAVAIIGSGRNPRADIPLPPQR